MSAEAEPLGFLGRRPDQRLLGDESAQLPASVGRPSEFVDAPARRRLVAVGAALTGITLVLGSVLVIFGALDGLVTAFGPISIAALLLGIVLVTTHWGWVHVAELSANKVQARSQRPVEARRQAWLEMIEPYPRWEVSTAAGDDGSIAILTVCCRPVVRGEDAYSFVRQEVAREVHPADEPAAAVTERAELLRREAALRTREARERFEAARDAYERTLIVRDDEQQRQAALRAASQALSERINSNLQDPPLVE